MSSSPARPIRLGKIGYVNTLPIYHPLESGQLKHDFIIESGVPAELNQRMARGEMDLSACSSIAYARNPDDYLLIPNLAIGSRGPVMSVLLLSKIPLAQLDGRDVAISFQTHTSAALLQLLLVGHLGVLPNFVTGSISTLLASNSPPDAFLAIGDEALRLRNSPDYPYQWDLGQAWIELTGLPFIFGVWVVNRRSAERLGPAMDEAVALLQESKRLGVAQPDLMAALASRVVGVDQDTMRTYFQGLCFDLGEWEIQGLSTFFAWLKQLGMITAVPPLRFFDRTGSGR